MFFVEGLNEISFLDICNVNISEQPTTKNHHKPLTKQLLHCTAPTHDYIE